MRLKLKTYDSIVHSSEYGGKAHWLSLLHDLGYNVPYAFFFPAVNNFSPEYFLNNQEMVFFQELLKPMAIGEKFDVAVRSSASGEDAFLNSYAGFFDSYIGQMSLEEIFNSIKKVVEGLKKVDSGISMQMGVVIQKRINAAFSGVIFSSNPITCAKDQ